MSLEANHERSSGHQKDGGLEKRGSSRFSCDAVIEHFRRMYSRPVIAKNQVTRTGIPRVSGGPPNPVQVSDHISSSSLVTVTRCSSKFAKITSSKRPSSGSLLWKLLWLHMAPSERSIRSLKLEVACSGLPLHSLTVRHGTATSRTEVPLPRIR